MMNMKSAYIELCKVIIYKSEVEILFMPQYNYNI